jgi:hypothetical protein
MHGHIDPAKPLKNWRLPGAPSPGVPGSKDCASTTCAITQSRSLPNQARAIKPSWIAGHVSRQMLDHYSHIRLAAKRRVLEALETPLPVSQPDEATDRRNAKVYLPSFPARNQHGRHAARFLKQGLLASLLKNPPLRFVETWLLKLFQIQPCISSRF